MSRDHCTTRTWFYRGVLLCIIAGYGSLMLHGNLHRYADGGATLDLGIVAQILWNTVHGRPLQTSLAPINGSILTEHFNPLYYPLALLYCWREDPRLILIVQTVIIMLTLIPLWHLASYRLGRPAALCIVGAFAANPVVQYINFFDFHPITCTMPLYAAALYRYYRRDFRRCAFLLFGTLFVDEAACAITACFGVFLLLHRHFRFGVWCFAISVCWFAVIITLIMPFVAGNGSLNYSYNNYFTYLAAPSGAGKLWYAATHPAVISQQLCNQTSAGYLFVLFANFAFLPLVAPSLLVPVFPQFVFNLLSDFHDTATIHLHYNATIVVFLIAGCIAAIRRLGNRLRFRSRPIVVPLAMFLLVISGLAHGFDSPLPFLTTRQYLYPGYGEPDRFAHARQLLRLIPAAASVGTEHKYWAYLAHRPQLYVFWDQHPEAEFYLLDTRETVVPKIRPTRADFIAACLAQERYCLLASNDGIVLLQRRPTSPDTATVPPLRDIAR